MTTTQETRPPVKTLRVNHIEAAIWAQAKEEDGRTFLQHSIRIQKRYKDKAGDWQSTDYFFPNELANLSLVADKAFEFISLKESGERERRFDNLIRLDVAAPTQRLAHQA